MTLSPRGFGSDNHATVHPQVMQALIEANRDHVPSYGNDPWSLQAVEHFRRHFGSQAEVFFVFNGTAANALALSALAQSGEAVLCSDVAHIHVDEAAAPELFTRCKLRPLPSDHGRLKVDELKRHLVRRGDVHYAQNTVLSLTQPTELGTLYSLEELKELCLFAKSQKLAVHMDGARLSVAAAALGVGFREMTTDLGVDIVSFGGTKNGLMGAEAIIVLNPALGKRLGVLRKQAGQLPSKSRFLAAQFSAYLEKDLWRELALHERRLALRLAEGLREFKQMEITHPVDSNAVFVRVPKGVAKKLREVFFFYVWDEATWECRWMLSWDLTEADVDGFLQLIRETCR